jgi:hypothetical protein
VSRPRAKILRLVIAATCAAIVLAAGLPSAFALTCGESGETPGVIESVLDGTHGRADRWQVIAAGTVTSVEPLSDDYGSSGAWIQMDVAYWFRGGDEPVLTFYDPPAGSSGVGFEKGERYLVLASDDLNWEGRLATGLCELTHRLSDFGRMEQLANQFGATMPDTGLSRASDSSWRLAGIVVLLLALASGLSRRSRSATTRR